MVVLWRLYKYGCICGSRMVVVLLLREYRGGEVVTLLREWWLRWHWVHSIPWHCKQGPRLGRGMEISGVLLHSPRSTVNRRENDLKEEEEGNLPERHITDFMKGGRIRILATERVRRGC